MRKLITLLLVLIVLLGVASVVNRYAPQSLPLFNNSSTIDTSPQKVKVASEESVTIDIVKKVGPSVVTVSEEVTPQANDNSGQFGFDPFNIFGIPSQGQLPNPSQPQAQSIGSGFIVSADGLIVTNKHVVSDTGGKYTIITSDDKKYTVQKIYRDPLNDVAILKVDLSQNNGKSLQPVILGDSAKLQVGQYACAIGTALGEFRNTVTTGVISGLGRGITAGDQFQGQAEDLNNVIQTSAAINP